jgi:hypothetical protein
LRKKTGISSSKRTQLIYCSPPTILGICFTINITTTTTTTDDDDDVVHKSYLNLFLKIRELNSSTCEHGDKPSGSVKFVEFLD